MSTKLTTVLILAIACSCATAAADELTKIIQQDLQTLSYAPGAADGEASVQTVVAISKFQAEHDLDVTGEASPQLAGIIKAAIAQGGQPAPASAQSPTPAVQPAPDPAALQAAQQACLQKKVADAQESQKRKRGFARLARAVSQTASRLGGNDVANEVSAHSSDVYSADAIAGDFKGAAKDLGLTESDIEACRNPQ